MLRLCGFNRKGPSVPELSFETVIQTFTLMLLCSQIPQVIHFDWELMDMKPESALLDIASLRGEIKQIRLFGL